MSREQEYHTLSTTQESPLFSEKNSPLVCKVESDEDHTENKRSLFAQDTRSLQNNVPHEDRLRKNHGQSTKKIMPEYNV